MTYLPIALVSTSGNFARNGTEEWGNTTVYPVTRHNILTHGAVGAPLASGYSGNSAVAGPDLISGRLAFTATNIGYQVDLPYGPGRYRIKLGISNKNSATTSSFGVYEDIARTLWVAGLSTITFTDKNYVADIAGNIYTTRENWWNAVDQDGAVGGGAYVEFTSTTGMLFFTKQGSNHAYLSAIQIEYQPDPLTDALLYVPEEAGAAIGPRAVDTVYSRQPAGEPFAILSSPVGLQNFTIIGGGLAPYLEIATIEVNGAGKLGLRHTATPIPDDHADRTLTIRQSSAGLTYDTPFTFPNIVNRAPGGSADQLLMPTQLWNRRELVRTTVFDNVWPGYQGETIDPANVHACNSTGAVAAALNGITPDGTSWYAIELNDAGDYTGNLGTIAAKDYGTGGVVFTRQAGHDPEVRFYGTFNGIRNIDFGDLRYTLRHTAQGADYIHEFIFNEPSITASTIYSRICTSRARVGWMFSDAAIADPVTAERTVVDDQALGNGNNWFFNSFMLIYHAESYCGDGTHFSGVQNHVLCFNTRYALSRPLFEYPNQDLGVFTQLYGANATKGVFADDDCFAWYEPTVHNTLDYAGLVSYAHSDLNQFRTYAAGTEPPRYNNGGFASNSGTFSNFNLTDKKWCTSPFNGTRWEVTAVNDIGADGNIYTGATVPPEFTADPATLTVGVTSVVDGDVTFVYRGRMPAWGCKQYLWYAGAAMHSGSYVTGSAPASIQFCINSNNGYGYPTIVGVENCISASPNSRGVTNDAWRVANGDQNLPRNEIWAWRTTFFGPSDTASERVDDAKIANANGVDCFTRRCIYAVRDAAANNGRINSSGDAVIGCKNGAVNPGTNIRAGTAAFEWVNRTDATTGPFSFWRWVAAFVDQGLTPDQFRSALSKALHYVDGSKGGRLREEHQIVAGTETFSLIIKPPPT